MSVRNPLGLDLLESYANFYIGAYSLKSKCGVALCTYNGERYLHEQLESITSQTQTPDTIVIFDDCSTDKTWDILNCFKLSTSIPTTIVRNAAQQGVVKNFELAVKLLDTEIIFLCDQDDIWLPNKIATVYSVFISSPPTNLVFTDAVLIDENGNDLGLCLFSELQLSLNEKRLITQGNSFDLLSRRNVVTGATSAFRSSLLAVALPFSENFFHDEWLALIASATGRIDRLPDSTIKYRQHGKNLVGVRKLSKLEICKDLWWSINRFNSRGFEQQRIKDRYELLDRITGQIGVAKHVITRCEESIRFAEFRAGLPKGFFMRFLTVARKTLTGHYRKFGYSWKTDIFRDLIHK